MKGRELVVGVTGGIAAYKTAALVSHLVQAGASVRVAMTRSAEKFVGRATFEALTGRPVVLRMFGDPEHPLGATSIWPPPICSASPRPRPTSSPRRRTVRPTICSARCTSLLRDLC